VIDAGFQDLKLDTPEWVVDRLSEIDQEINIRTRNELLKRLRAAKARRSALLSKDERRQNLEAEIADLEGKLA
jgi:precorrin-4 methylase